MGREQPVDHLADLAAVVCDEKRVARTTEVLHRLEKRNHAVYEHGGRLKAFFDGVRRGAGHLWKRPHCLTRSLPTGGSLSSASSSALRSRARSTPSRRTTG
ncbi:predicted protein [Streptomyces viridochromogenes DSM 40736]|uniref:Predicted protein n=1 Tax=Streptomyces viridochromogenes (strain DSM 40736 / JCM 4977 / BCRC 1201 / Tue 494) TaxID=591159 RepID=D9XH08_STRVT|nr:predicted protein [Streptomyces viridochromogenes DSM 40736]